MMKAGPLEGWSDEALAGLAARAPGDSGGRQAAEILLGRHARTVYRWCYRLVEDQEVAQDLTQEILLSAYRNLGRFEGWGRFSAWLFVICRNRCLDALRKRSLLYDEWTETLADARPRPDRQLEDREEEERLLLLVRDHLTPQEQEALWLRCYEGMPVDVITRLLEIEQSTGARAVLQNARRKLRAALESSSGRPRPAGGPGAPDREDQADE